MVHFYPSTDGRPLAGNAERPLPSVTTILKATMPCEQRATLDLWYASQSPDSSAKLRKNEESKRRGLAVDAWAKAFLQREPLPEVDHKFAGHCKQLRPILEQWQQEYEAVLCDRVVYDLARGYAGTLDIALCKAGIWTVVDIKTRDYIYLPALEEAKLQCLAYGEALATDGYTVGAIAPLVVTSKKAELVMVDELEPIAKAWAARLAEYGGVIAA